MYSEKNDVFSMALCPDKGMKDNAAVQQHTLTSYDH